MFRVFRLMDEEFVAPSIFANIETDIGGIWMASAGEAS